MDNNQQKNNPKPIKGRPQKKDELKDAYRVNEKITAKEVRLVGDNVEQGVYSIYDARAIAEEQELAEILKSIYKLMKGIGQLF